MKWSEVTDGEFRRIIRKSQQDINDMYRDPDDWSLRLRPSSYKKGTLLPIAEELYRIRPDIDNYYSRDEIIKIIDKVYQQKAEKHGNITSRLRFRLNDDSHESWAIIQDIVINVLQILDLDNLEEL